jgi:hypothetical protein
MIPDADPNHTRAQDGVILYNQFENKMENWLLLKFFFDPFPVVNC